MSDRNERPAVLGLVSADPSLWLQLPVCSCEACALSNELDSCLGGRPSEDYISSMLKQQQCHLLKLIEFSV